jgi:hypothetical protein
LCFVLSACATRTIQFPTDPGQPFTDFTAVHGELSRACSGIRTLTAELSLSGRAGTQRLRGRVVSGFERPASMRLEGVAPFGPPAFILVSRAGSATLLLPRDNGVLRGAQPDQILGALTGVALGPGELQAILTGCVEAAPRATAGRIHANGWASIDLMGGSTLYLQRSGAAWQLRGARRAGWDIEYPEWQGALPRAVRLRATTSSTTVDLTATVSQLETNRDLDAAAFEVTVPAGAVPITLDELRDAGPLQGS